jgi:hypothetical protein
MRRFLTVTAVTAMLLAPAVISAQTTFNRPLPTPNGLNDPYESGLRLYSKTWSDLNAAQKHVVPYPGDWYRADKTLGQMNLLERAWQDGSFTRAQLNDATEDLRFVLQVNNLSDQDRDTLEQDLNGLRDLRIRYGQ